MALWGGLTAIGRGARAALGLDVPLGPDPALWGLAASTAAQGQLPDVAPGYPLLVALASMASGAVPWKVGGVLSVAVASGIAPATAALGLRLGLSHPAAALAAVATLLAPDLLSFGVQLQPDALATAALLGVLWAGLRFEDRPTWARAAAWMGTAAALATIREHGVLVLGAVPLALMARRRPAWALVLSMAAVVAALVAFQALPDRLAVPLRESPFAAGAGPVPDYVKELPAQLAEAMRHAWERGDRLTVVAIVLSRLLVRSGANLVAIALGLAGFGLAWRGRIADRVPWAALVALSPTVALFAVWSHRRHTSVLLPIAVLGLLSGGRHLARRWPSWRRRSQLAALVGLGLAATRLPAAYANLATGAARAREAREVAAWMSGEPGVWLLGGVHNEVNLFLLWPRHNPSAPEPGAPLPRSWSGTDWRTMWVGPVGSMPPPFTQVHVADRLAVFRLEPPPGVARPCADVLPDPGVLFATRPVVATSSPSCEAEPWFGPPPAPRAHHDGR
jgi:hypothetical protein